MPTLAALLNRDRSRPRVVGATRVAARPPAQARRLCARAECCWWDVPASDECHEPGSCGCKAVAHPPEACA